MKIFSTSKSKKASTPDTIGSSDVTENGKQKSSGSLRSVSKRLSKSFQRAGEMITGIGPLPIKVCRDAVMASDEEKAISVFVNDMLTDKQQTWTANSPISTTKGTGVTLLHLAAQMALQQFLVVLLEHHGNPNAVTSRMETALHFLCGECDVPEKRRQILDLLLAWREKSEVNNIVSTVSSGSPSNAETVSVNRIDFEGNSALHKAATNGLTRCVLKLIEAGAILSIVNKSQLTCCELADENGHKELASLLELALMFQPEDDETAAFIAQQQFQYESHHSRLLPDCKSIRLENVSDYAKDLINALYVLFKSHPVYGKGVTYARIAVFLEKFSWDALRLKKEFGANPASVFAACHVPEVCIPYPKWDVGPWVDAPTSQAQAEAKESIPVPSQAPADVPPAAAPAENAATQQEPTTADAMIDSGVSQSNASAGKDTMTQQMDAAPAAAGGTAADAVDIDDISLAEIYPSAAEAANGIHGAKIGSDNAADTSSVSAVVEDNSAVVAHTSAADVPNPAASIDGMAAGIEQADCRLAGSPAVATRPATIRVKLLCPNIRLRIRPEPSTQVTETGYAASGDEFEVYPEAVDGFFKLADNKGYIQKQLNGVFWEYLDSNVRDFVPEMCQICGEDLAPPVPPSLLLQQFRESGGSAPNNGEKSLRIPNLDQRAIYCSSGHGFCLSCYRANTQTQIRENGAFCIKCPAYKCPELLGEEWMPVLIYQPRQGPGSENNSSAGSTAASRVNLYERYNDNFSQHAVDCCQQLHRCPHAGCEHIVVLPDFEWNLPHEVATQLQSVFTQCGRCQDGHSFCFACRKEAHAPCSCVDWSSWKTRVGDEMKALNMPNPFNTNANNSSGGNSSSEEMANAMWVAANTKPCPRCSSHIEKDEGCNHMSCRKCRYEFCWICMQDWSLHNSATGGFFQCNRFIAEQAQAAASSTGSGGAFGGEPDLLMFTDEYGNAQAESIRRRKHTQRVARFIHHFTRFQAHGDSQTMEARMHTDTIARIVTSLVRSAQGPLIWPLQHIPHPLMNDASYVNVSESSFMKELFSTFGGNSQTERVGSTVSRTSLSTDQHQSSSTTTTPAHKDKKKSSLIGALIHSVSKRPGHPQKQHSRDSQFTPTASLDDAGGSNALATVSADSQQHQNTNKEVGGVRLDCIAFLNNGFDELIKCRMFLRSAFPFAFFAFAEEDHDSHNNYESLAAFLNTTGPTSQGASASGGPAGLTYPQRKALKLRMLSRKIEFEQLQTDLEMLTEMLSDVVARRRLRASQSQIQQVTRAARNKRMEFESVLYSWLLADIYTIKDIKEREQLYATKQNNYLGANARRILQLQRQHQMQQQQLAEQQRMAIEQRMQSLNQRMQERDGGTDDNLAATDTTNRRQNEGSRGRSRSSSGDDSNDDDDHTRPIRTFRPGQPPPPPSSAQERSNRVRAILMGDAPASASSSSASAPSASSSSAAPQADPAAPQQHRSRQHRSHHHRHAQPSDAHNNSNNALRNLSAFAQTRNTGVGAGGGLGAFHDEEDEIMQLILMINAMDAMEALEGQQQQQQQVTSSSSSSSGPVAMAAPFAGAVSDTPGDSQAVQADGSGSGESTSSPSTNTPAPTSESGNVANNNAAATPASAAAPATLTGGESETPAVAASTDAGAQHHHRSGGHRSRSHHHRNHPAQGANTNANVNSVDWLLRTANNLDGTPQLNNNPADPSNQQGNPNILSLNDLSNLSAFHQSQLTFQVEEMADLNRAILMSLREAEDHAGGPGGPGGASGAAGYTPSEGDVEMLVCMGFEREAAVGALRRCNGNVERAADFLVSSA